MEAHRQLVSSSSTYYKFCENIWDRVEKHQDYQYEYMLRLEDEFLFNFIHVASHFKKGGVGISFIVDIWIYKQSDMNWEYIKDSLEYLNLTRFYNAIDILSEKWFEKKKMTMVLSMILKTIFSPVVFLVILKTEITLL